MADVRIMLQPTPNPNAFKFIINYEMKTQGKATFNSKDEAAHIPLIQNLFEVDGTLQVHAFENVLTITYTPLTDLIHAEEASKRIIKEWAPSHNPQFEMAGVVHESERRAGLSAEILLIEEILDETIRPALRGDGGDIEVLTLEGTELTVRYQGACGSCPSSTMGTLMAIEGILKDRFDPDIKVTPI